MKPAVPVTSTRIRTSFGSREPSLGLLRAQGQPAGCAGMDAKKDPGANAGVPDQSVRTDQKSRWIFRRPFQTDSLRTEMPTGSVELNEPLKPWPTFAWM